MTRVIIIVCDVPENLRQLSGFNRSIECDMAGDPDTVFTLMRGAVFQAGGRELFERDRTQGAERME